MQNTLFLDNQIPSPRKKLDTQLTNLSHSMYSSPIIKVLLVEDDEDDCLITRELLAEINSSQYDVEWISTYEEALVAIASHRHDVILVDFYLGASTGLEILQFATARGCKIPIIMLTGLGDREVDNKAIQAGASDYLVKGHLDPQLLERSIRHSIERKYIEKALRESEAKYRALAQREALLNRLAKQIRNSLELPAVLNTAVSEICTLLNIDRCQFIWHKDYVNNSQKSNIDNSGNDNEEINLELVCQACDPTIQNSTSFTSNEEIIALSKIIQGLNLAESSIFNINLTPEIWDSMAVLNFPFMLIIPVRTSTNKMGILVCERWLDLPATTPYEWDQDLVELLMAVADQIAIAIGQSELYESTRIAREQSDRLLLNILPQTVAERLKNNEEVIADSFAEVTVLFADIVSFTELATQVSAPALVQLLNRIFSNFDALAEKHKLEKIKTIGDAYMVVGGVPLPREDHAEAIAAMAIEMQQEISKFFRDDDLPFSLRMGIATGSAVAGVIGTTKFIYDIWGDTVNIASRMETLGEPGKIQVTTATYERLKSQFVFEQRGAISVKGKGDMITYWLTGFQESPTELKTSK